MIQITPQMRILLAVEPVDFRNGIDGLAGVCRKTLGCDPFSGWLFIFRNRRATALKILVYDGQGLLPMSCNCCCGTGSRSLHGLPLHGKSL